MQRKLTALILLVAVAGLAWAGWAGWQARRPGNRAKAAEPANRHAGETAPVFAEPGRLVADLGDLEPAWRSQPGDRNPEIQQTGGLIDKLFGREPETKVAPPENSQETPREKAEPRTAANQQTAPTNRQPTGPLRSVLKRQTNTPAAKSTPQTMPQTTPQMSSRQFVAPPPAASELAPVPQTTEPPRLAPPPVETPPAADREGVSSRRTTPRALPNWAPTRVASRDANPTFDNPAPRQSASPHDVESAPITPPETAATDTASALPAASASELGPVDDGASRRGGSRPLFGAVASTPLTRSKGPQLLVETIGPASLRVGKPAAYEVVLSNLGDVEAHEVVVSVNLPEEVKIDAASPSAGAAREGVLEGARLGWALESMPPRSQEKLALTIIPQSNQTIEWRVDWYSKPTPITTSIPVQEPRLALELQGPREALQGEKVRYKLVARNQGTGDAESVSIRMASTSQAETSDELGRLAVLGAGQQQEVVFDVLAREPGRLPLRLFAVASDGLRAELVDELVVRQPKLEVRVVGPRSKYLGATADYQVLVVNTGDASADNLDAAAALPEGAEYLGGIAGAQALPGGVKWKIAALPPGGEQRFAFRCRLNKAGENRVEVGARGARDLSAASFANTRVEAVADLKLLVNEPRGPMPLENEVAYEVKIANRGAAAARDVIVVVQFSEGLEPTRAEGGKHETGPGQVVFAPIANIPPEGEVALTVHARAEETGLCQFRVEVKTDTPETRLVTEGVTRFFADDVSPAAQPAPQPALQPATQPTMQPAAKTPRLAPPPPGHGGDFRP